MSPEQNAAVVQGMFDAFAGADLPAILEALAPDVEWVCEGPAIIPYAGTRQGEAGVVEFLTAMVGTLDMPLVYTESVIAQGDQVVTHGRFSATVKATGKSFECRCAHVVTVRNGKIVQFLDFADTALIAAAYTPD